MRKYSINAYIQVFKKIFELEDEEYIKKMSIETKKEWDSFMHIELVLAIEERFQIKFSGKDILEFLSFEKGKTILKEKGIELEEV